jgi:hypothetical protein
VLIELLLITLDYQQRHICSGSEITIDGCYKPLQVNFSVVVFLHTTKRTWIFCPCMVQNTAKHHQQFCLIKKYNVSIDAEMERDLFSR